MKKYLFTLIICLMAMAGIAQDSTAVSAASNQNLGEGKVEYLYYKAKDLPTKCIKAKNKSESYIRQVTVVFYDKYQHMRQSIQLSNIRPGKKARVDYINLTRMLKTWGKQLDSKNFDLVVEIDLTPGFEILSTQERFNKLVINIIDKGAWK